jgi:hypothetical protein
MRYTACILFFCFFFNSGKAQRIINKDKRIADMVAQVNADSLHSYIHQLVAFGTRNTLSNEQAPGGGLPAAREWVASRFRAFARNSGGRMTVSLDTWKQPGDGRRVDKEIVMANPMAFLKGTDPNDKRIFIISGHLDSRASDVMDQNIKAPGANDDGSGCAAVLECARIMSKHEFPASIIFVTVTGEEQGLLGSEHLAKEAVEKNWLVAAVLNNDIVGSNNSSGTRIINNTQVRVFSEGLPAFELGKKAARIRALGLESDGDCRQLARYIKETGERYVDNLEIVPVFRNDRFLRGGDHTPFVQRGFTAVRITEMNENFEHQHQTIRKEKGIQYGDMEEFMDFEYLRKNTAMNLSTLANLALAPSQPQEVSVDVSDLSNSTQLEWKAPANGNISGYYILLRETYQGLWQKKIFTKETSIELPYSKDNYFFAVQAISDQGNESLPVVPGIKR